MFFGAFRVTLPDWAARISLLSISALLVWRYSKVFPKLLIVAVCITAVSILLGFI